MISPRESPDVDDDVIDLWGYRHCQVCDLPMEASTWTLLRGLCGQCLASRLPATLAAVRGDAQGETWIAKTPWIVDEWIPQLRRSIVNGRGTARAIRDQALALLGQVATADHLVAKAIVRSIHGEAPFKRREMESPEFEHAMQTFEAVAAYAAEHERRHQQEGPQGRSG